MSQKRAKEKRKKLRLQKEESKKKLINIANEVMSDESLVKLVDEYRCIYQETVRGNTPEDWLKNHGFAEYVDYQLNTKIKRFILNSQDEVLEIPNELISKDLIEWLELHGANFINK